MELFCKVNQVLAPQSGTTSDGRSWKSTQVTFDEVNGGDYPQSITLGIFGDLPKHIKPGAVGTLYFRSYVKLGSNGPYNMLRFSRYDEYVPSSAATSENNVTSEAVVSEGNDNLGF